MGMFDRISRIVRSNLNALLDKAEEPEVMLEQLIADLQENMREVKMQIARAIKDEKLLQNKLDDHKGLLTACEEKALVAIEQNRDDLARESLKKKKSYEKMTGGLEAELAEQNKMVQLLKTSYQALEAKIKEARHKRELLISRQKRAETKIGLSETMATTDEQNDIFDAFDKMAFKVAKKEAMASALMEMGNAPEPDSPDPESPVDEIEDDLQLLKMKVKKGS